MFLLIYDRSIRTNCPAHIMLRASKDGTKLEVTSVNNEHNHEISEVRRFQQLILLSYYKKFYSIQSIK